MRKMLIVVALAAIAMAETARGMDGVAVAVTWRNGCEWISYPQAPEVGGTGVLNGTPAGALCKYTITANRTTKCDTLVNRSQGLAQYPAISLDGQMVAFYHWGARVQGTQCVGASNPNYIAVVDINGQTITDLVELDVAPTNEIALAWPGGDWIYYVQPKRSGNAPWAQAQQSVYRVNFRTRKSEKLFTINDGSGTPAPSTSFIRRFTLSVDAKRMGIQIMAMVNGAYCFPPPGGTLTDHLTNGCGVGGCPCACNFTLSCGGCYGAGYYGGAHQEVYMAKMQTPSPECTGPETPSSQPTLDKAAAYLGSGVGGGAECIRWAANSDKWMTECVGWFGHADAIYEGSNSLGINWVDNEYIRVTNNPKVDCKDCACATVGSCTGQLWIGGGPANSWQDATGKWRTMGTTQTAAGTQGRNGFSSIAIERTRQGITIASSAQKNLMVRLIDVRGRAVAMGRGTGELSFRSLPPGIYTVQASAGDSETARETGYAVVY
jgi:hypothetical protein